MPFRLQPSQSTTIFGRVELSEALPPIAAAGYNVVELSRNSAHRARHSKMAADLGLRVWAVHGTLDVLAAMGTERERRAAVDDEIRAMEAVAVYAPCPYVIHYLCRNTEPEGREDWKRVVERLHERAAALGFVLALETVPMIPSEQGGLPYLVQSAEAADFVRGFQSPHVGVCLDVNHVNLTEDLADAARHFAGLIATVHLSDNHGVHEEHLPPGEGTINWLPALRAIYEAGYAGPLNMELHVPPSHGLLVRAREWAERAAESLRAALCPSNP